MCLDRDQLQLPLLQEVVDFHQSVPISPVLLRQDLVWGVKMLLKEAKMLIMITRHCSWHLPPLASLPLPPLAPWHLLPAWLLSTIPCCAHHAALLLTPTMPLPADPGEARCCGREWGRKGKENTFCTSYIGMEIEVPSRRGWLHPKVLWKTEGSLAAFPVCPVFGSAVMSSSGTVAAVSSHVPSVTEWQGPGSKENRQIPKKNSRN